MEFDGASLYKNAPGTVPIVHPQGDYKRGRAHGQANDPSESPEMVLHTSGNGELP
jgi:hypothetical protein